MIRARLRRGLRQLERLLGSREASASSETLLGHGQVEPDFLEIYEQCRPFTMTTAQEMYNLWVATRHVVARDLAGDFVECGVWRGGSAMVVACTLLASEESERRLFLYDTFEGMPEASEADTTYFGSSAGQVRTSVATPDGDWNLASIEEVRANLLSTGFPEDRLVLVKGKVEESIPGTVPERIALLRLDTDFYESTYHELEHLFPRLSSGGILIVDDYDFWQGAQRAVDRYFAEQNVQMLLQRMDIGRIGLKP